MIYVFPDENGNCAIHYKPELLTKHDKQNGFAVENLPVPETREGKQAILKFDKATKQLSYEYVDITLSAEEQRIRQLEDRIEELERQINNLFSKEL